MPADNRFIIGSNPEEQTGPSYVSWLVCGLPDPTDLATIFPTMHIVFDVNGSCPAGQITLSAAEAQGERNKYGASHLERSDLNQRRCLPK